MGADYAGTYDPDTDFDRYYTIATSKRIAEWIAVGDSVIELGCATGLMTSETLSHCNPESWLAIDRSESYLDQARNRGIRLAEFAVGDLDALKKSERRYNHVLATNVLHELSDPIAFLKECSELLTVGGSIHLSLQNPHSIHRVCALEMGLISSLVEISGRGHQWGTRQLWTADDLANMAIEAGLTIVHREGVMLKPLPNYLMNELPEAVIDGFIRSAKHFPDACAMNYLVLRSG